MQITEPKNDIRTSTSVDIPSMIETPTGLDGVGVFHAEDLPGPHWWESVKVKHGPLSPMTVEYDPEPDRAA